MLLAKKVHEVKDFFSNMNVEAKLQDNEFAKIFSTAMHFKLEWDVRSVSIVGLLLGIFYYEIDDFTW